MVLLSNSATRNFVSLLTHDKLVVNGKPLVYMDKQGLSWVSLKLQAISAKRNHLRLHPFINKAVWLDISIFKQSVCHWFTQKFVMNSSSPIFAKLTRTAHANECNWGWEHWDFSQFMHLDKVAFATLPDKACFMPSSWIHASVFLHLPNLPCSQKYRDSIRASY